MLRQVLGQMFKAKGAPAPQAVPPAAAPPPRGQDEAAKLDALIEHAAGLVGDVLPPTTRERVETMARAFVPPAGRAPADLHVFVFHVEMGEAGKLQYRDITMDVNRFDYAAVLQTFQRCVRRWHPRAHIFLATSRGSPLAALADDGTTVVELDLTTDQPMYERVHAMCAYARSAAFVADTLFLDSDAFINANVAPYLDADFDIAITTRNALGLMPVNEGVIVARAARPERVRGFFNHYLATYEALRVDERVVAHYGDIRKWRGGQLSLNAVTRAAHPFPAMRRIEVVGATIQCLPCDPFNYSYEYGQKVTDVDLARKVIVHLKGGRKNDMTAALAVIEGRPTTPAAPPPIAAAAKVGFADRKYSLDTTFPEEFVPTEAIDADRASLTELADHFRTDKGSIKHHYTKVYERYLEDLRGRPVLLLEIGVACGSSLKMWAAYFGPSSSVKGLDIRPECAALCKDHDNIDIVIGDAARYVPASAFDVIIDDGSHVSKDIVDAWSNLWPQLRPGGLYVVEDMRCTHDDNYRANFIFPKDPHDFDRRHVMAWLDQIMRSIDYGATDVEYIHVYRQLVVMQKKS